MLSQDTTPGQAPPRSQGYEHGASGYRNHGCRCDTCRTGHRERLARYRRANTLTGPDDHRHGTNNAYINFGCRCLACRQAHADVAAGRQIG